MTSEAIAVSIYAFIGFCYGLNEASKIAKYSSDDLDSEDWFCVVMLGLLWPFAVLDRRSRP